MLEGHRATRVGKQHQDFSLPHISGHGAGQDDQGAAQRDWRLLELTQLLPWCRGSCSGMTFPFLREARRHLRNMQRGGFWFFPPAHSPPSCKDRGGTVGHWCWEQPLRPCAGGLRALGQGAHHNSSMVIMARYRICEVIRSLGSFSRRSCKTQPGWDWQCLQSLTHPSTVPTGCQCQGCLSQSPQHQVSPHHDILHHFT